MTIVNSTEPNDTFSQANAVSLGNTIIGSLSSGTDWDFYKVVMPVSGVLRIDMSSSQLPNWAYTVQVYDASHKLLGEDALGYVDSGSFSVGAQAAGTYYIGVTSSNIYSGLSYSITPSLGSGSAQDYEVESNDTLQTATPVSLDHLISGQQSGSSDVDNFSINVTSAGMLSLDFKAPEKLDYAYYQVNVYDSQGRLIDQKTSGDSFSLLEAGISAGKYTVQVKQSGAVSGYEGGNYTFFAHLDSGSSLPAKATLSDGAPITASIGATNQTDWYKLDLKAGSAYEFRLSGAQSGGGTLADSSLLLCTADGKVLENCSNLPTWNGGETVQSADPQIAFVAPYSGTCYLKVAGFAGTGSYTLTEKTDALTDLTMALTGDAFTQEHWAASFAGIPLILTYSFLTAATDGEVGFKEMNASQKQAVRNVLAQYSALANIDFIEVSNPALAQICYGTSDQHGKSGGVTYPITNVDGTLTHADVFINNTASFSGSQAEADTLSAGQYGLETLIHETGHALGLKHPGDYNVLTGGGVAPFIPAAWDNHKFSVMSYIDNPDATVYDQSPSLLDVAAIQSLYGARTSSAGKTFSFSNSTEFKAALLGGSAASNTLDLSNQTADCFISLTPGTFSSVGLKQDGTLAHDNLAIPYGCNIGKLIAGSGNDYIIGSTGADIIYGGAGNDTIVGMTGNDVIDGGAGTDELLLDTDVATTHLAKLRSGAVVVFDKNGNLALCRDIEQIKFVDANVDVASLNVHDNIDPILTQIYVAGFQRAPETEGSNYWMQETATKGMTAVADIIFSLDSVKAIYPTNMTSAQFVTAIYQNVFDRAPDSEGLNYWVQQLAAKSRGQLVIDMTNAALSVSDGTSGKDYFQNRLDWALYAVGYQVDKSAVLTPDHLATLTASVTDDSMTVATLIGQAEVSVAI